MRIAILSSIKTARKASSKPLAPSRISPADEQGWALLGIMLALAIMGIMLAAMAPNVSFQVRRDKEAEMLYRGDEMAKAIARYYNSGQVGTINPGNCPQPRGCLVDLEKIREPYIVGVNEIKLIRLSATIDPMTNSEWEPVRVCDPRLMTVFQAYMAATQLQVPDLYLGMAAPLPPLVPDPASSSNSQTGGSVVVTPPTLCERLSGSGNSGPGQDDLPIIGVAPKIKGDSVRTLYGLGHYEEWVFIYIPPKV